MIRSSAVVVMTFAFSTVTGELAAQTPRRTAADTVADSAKVFRLGTIEVTGAPDAHSPALIDRRTAADLRRYNRDDLSQALNLFPGVTLSNVGPRNEAGVYVRGFDLRQTPLFIDGIPVYVPYDGYVDLRRFTTFDASEVQVSKGFSSTLLGPNTLGGAINMVSRRPAAPIEANGGLGAFSVGGYEAYLNLGTRQNHWYGLVSGSYLTQDGFRLSDDFVPVPVQGPNRRSNADRTDGRISGKLGYTPNATDEYAVGYLNQQGDKGTPPYAGTDPTQPVRFWRWPQWDKQSVYGLTQTALGSKVQLKTRLYYDQFKNQLFTYDDSTYTTQLKGSSFQSFYDDDTWGVSAELGWQPSSQIRLGVAAHTKKDTHREHNLNEPVRVSQDRTSSFGIEATAQATDRLTFVGGASYDRRDGIRADDYQNKQVSSLPVSSSGSLNPEIAALYSLGRAGTLRASVARKTRYPTIKDRYSYRLGAAIPNPNLKAEGATHFEVGYVSALSAVATIRANLFLSRIDDLIQQVNNVAQSPTGQALFQLQNVGDARNAGFELGADLHPARWLDAGANYTFLDRKNLTNPNIKLIDTPQSKVFSYANIFPHERVGGVATFEWNSSRYTTSQGAKVGAFTLVNLKAQVRVTSWITLESGINNLFDRNYELYGGFPEPGRTFFVNLTYDFVRGRR